ncbi:hypothetical protein [Rhodococcus sp. NPDC058514]|uniref:hypothetical protein n=1 Tax=Rhodococcus sp. NPDC058514 TaxID=3346532 RepID=UPI0036640037
MVASIDGASATAPAATPVAAMNVRRENFDFVVAVKLLRDVSYSVNGTSLFERANKVELVIQP